VFKEVEKIKREVARKWGFRVSDLEGPGRHKTLAFARHEAMYRVKHETPLSYPEIGYFFGRRDHSSVIYGVNSYKRKRELFERLPGKVLMRKKKNGNTPNP